jgi:hypothetical protein
MRLRCRYSRKHSSYQRTLLNHKTTSSDRPGPDENGIYHIGNGVTAPALVYSVAPEFSEEARKHKVTANITVEFMVDNDGHTDGFHVTKTEGWPHSSKKDMSAIHSLESKTIEAVSQSFQTGYLQRQICPLLDAC